MGNLKQLKNELEFVSSSEKVQIIKDMMGDLSLDDRINIEEFVIDEFIKCYEDEPATRDSDALQRLNTIISAHFGTPQMNNSHLLDRREAIELTVKINNHIRKLESDIRVCKSGFAYVEKSKVKELLRLAYVSGEDYDSFNEFIEMATDFKEL